MSERQALMAQGERAGTLLRPPTPNQLYTRVTEGDALRQLGRWLVGQGYYLVTMAATDERELVDHCFKLTYLFSHPRDDLFLFVEHPVEHDHYVSLHDLYPAADPFERELADLMGLYPRSEDAPQRLAGGAWLHGCYPPGLFPLRRERTTLEIVERIERHYGQWREADVGLPPDGQWFLPVGPIHAGVIEPGRFLFRLAGEVVEELDVRLGYVHKGIERLFQTGYVLLEGQRLAEHVSGDSAFAHSLAYCRAAEALASTAPPLEARLLRVLFLELERLANHVGDCGALAHDVAYDLAASELAGLRERLLRLARRLAGHRLLRGVNRPGGVVLPRPLDVDTARRTVAEVAAHFGDLAYGLVHLAAFRNRLQGVGVLTRQQALALGVTGLAARASGLARDFRLQHPAGAYREEAIRELVEQGHAAGDDSIEAREATAGDSLARFWVRVREVDSAARMIQHVLARPELATGETRFVETPAFRAGRNFEFGLGYAEGWRGDVVYWLMQDKFGRIYRCKVRDPSVLNWRGLKAAVEPHLLDGEYLERYRPPRPDVHSIVPDFPVINKSFNLSYSGSDL